MKRQSLLLLAAVILTAAPLSATRPFGVHGAGPRIGTTINPDQFHFGAHFDLGDLAPRLMLFPNIEIGVGDDYTVTSPAFELDYRFLRDWGSWSPYLGGGIGPVFVSERHGFGNDTRLGITVQGGLSKRLISQSGFFFMEMKLGLADAPDMKFTAGWTFGK